MHSFTFVRKKECMPMHSSILRIVVNHVSMAPKPNILVTSFGLNSRMVMECGGSGL